MRRGTVTNKYPTERRKKKMNKTKTMAMTLLLLLGLLISMIPIFVVTSTAAENTSQPTYFMEYSNAYATAVVNVPSIGNITRMTIAAIHQDKSSTIDNYEVLVFQLSSSLTQVLLLEASQQTSKVTTSAREKPSATALHTTQKSTATSP